MFFKFDKSLFKHLVTCVHKSTVVDNFNNKIYLRKGGLIVD